MKNHPIFHVLVLGLLALGFKVPGLYAQSISPTNVDVEPAGGTGSVTVIAPGSWTASSDDAWIQISSPASGTGTGNGTVQYTVLPNPTTNDINHYVRVGTLSVAGHVFTVAQHPAGLVSYAQWALSLPGNANQPNQSAAGDGIANIVKYAFGLDPLTPAKGGLPTLSQSGGAFTYSLTKPQSVTGVRYTARTINAITDTNSVSVPLSKVGETAGMETWQASIPGGASVTFVPSTVVQVGVTAREVQKLLRGSFDAFSTNYVLWNIQPGLGTVMIEYGRRMAMMKLAADAGDWGMAQYQLTEALEIQETGETTRPAKAPLLKAFEQSYLETLAADIQAKDGASFANHFNEAVVGCNACHAATGHAYVQIQTPAQSPEALLYFLASQPKTPTTNPPPVITPAADTPLTFAEVQQTIDNTFNIVDRTLPLWNIQPGLGTVMMEYGRRMAMMKLAADAGDWGMAQYQLTEAVEIQETGEMTRPANAPLLKDFEQSYLDPLAADILAKNGSTFTDHFNQTVTACNACHVITGHSYARVQVPTNSPQPFLILASSLPVTPTTNAPPTPNPITLPPGAPTPADVLNLISNRFDNLDPTLTLWKIQPGLGTVMQEYGYRFAMAWLAAEADNWGMAGYQLQEAIEIQETGETTRPGKAPILKAFEQGYLDPVITAINVQNKSNFESSYQAAVVACNACHVATGHSYVRVQTPPGVLSDYLKLTP